MPRIPERKLFWSGGPDRLTRFPKGLYRFYWDDGDENTTEYDYPVRWYDIPFSVVIECLPEPVFIHQNPWVWESSSSLASRLLGRRIK